MINHTYGTTSTRSYFHTFNQGVACWVPTKVRSHRSSAGARTTCTSVAYGIGLISIIVAVFESKYCARSQENEHQNEAKRSKHRTVENCA